MYTPCTNEFGVTDYSDAPIESVDPDLWEASGHDMGRVIAAEAAALGVPYISGDEIFTAPSLGLSIDEQKIFEAGIMSAVAAMRARLSDPNGPPSLLFGQIESDNGNNCGLA